MRSAHDGLVAQTLDYRGDEWARYAPPGHWAYEWLAELSPMVRSRCSYFPMTPVARRTFRPPRQTYDAAEEYRVGVRAGVRLELSG
jgi:hypothetical protein